MAEQLPIDFTDRKAPILTDEERRIWNIITERRGLAAAILGPAIAEVTGIDYVTMRAIISHLVNFHGYLIASCSHGYYVPVTPEEIITATKSLRIRGIKILRRAARLQNSSMEDVFGQATLDLLEAGKNEDSGPLSQKTK
jgi:hypothetical protein